MRWLLAALMFVFTCRVLSPPVPLERGGREDLELLAGCAEVAEVLHASWGRFESVNKSRKEGGPAGSPVVQWLRSTLPRQGGWGQSSQETKIPRAAQCGPNNCFLI